MRIPKKKLVIPVLIIILILIRFVVDIGPEKSVADRFQVTSIIDGDTFELSGGDKVRLLAIDCPEIGNVYYDSAKAFLSELIGARVIEIEYSKRHRDGYGRILGYVYIDSVFVNAEILKMGYGNIYLFKDNLKDTGKIEKLIEAQDIAMNSGLGIWSISRQPEKYYLVKKGSLRFHRLICGTVKNADWGQLEKYDSREEAFRAGYSPCRNCRP